jgi:hypothetical protein
MFMRLHLVFKVRKSSGLAENTTNPRCRGQSLPEGGQDESSLSPMTRMRGVMVLIPC